MIQVGDSISVNFEFLKEQYGSYECENGHTCLNTFPTLISRYNYRNMTVTSVTNEFVYTNNGVFRHDWVILVEDGKKVDTLVEDEIYSHGLNPIEIEREQISNYDIRAGEEPNENNVIIDRPGIGSTVFTANSDSLVSASSRQIDWSSDQPDNAPL